MEIISVLSEFVDKQKSIEELEGDRWSDPPQNSTTLVRSVHALRRYPVKDLSVENLARLIGQDVGLRWLLPVALDFLRETAPDEAVTGWYDDDLLSAVLTREDSVWRAAPNQARHLNETVNMLTDLSESIQRQVDDFRVSVAEFL
jgi:hypothetical protein